MTTERCVLITSGAYIGPELSLEIGRLPPSFLPIGNRRLFEHQASLIKKIFPTYRVFLTVPATYNISFFDRRKLNELKIELIAVPDNSTLTESIAIALNSFVESASHLTIIHGDTLILDYLPKSQNEYSAHTNFGGYPRGIVTQKNGNLQILAQTDFAKRDQTVLSGIFTLSDPATYLQLLQRDGTSFIKSLQNYSRTFPTKINQTGQWLDFGRAQNYFSSRAHITTQRAFNSLQIISDARQLRKSSSNKNNKIASEISWYEKIPNNLRSYIPTYCGSHTDEAGLHHYNIEYLPNLPLSDRFVFGDYDSNDWPSISNSILKLLNAFKQASSSSSNKKLELSTNILKAKSVERVAQFNAQIDQRDHDINVGWRKETVNLLNQILSNNDLQIRPTTKENLSIIHGDFCFSNIIYDPRTMSSKCFDPRGENFKGAKTIYGDLRYDLAKLYHSAYGYYDLIIAKRFNGTVKEAIDLQNQSHSFVCNDIEKLVLEPLKQDINELKIIVLHLFVSMLPLHYDDFQRQRLLINNIKRIYQDICKT